MNVLNIYSYMFYRIHLSYVRWGESDIPGLYALGIITISQTFIVAGIFGIIAKQIMYPPYINKYYAGGFALTLLFFNYLYIYKKKGEKAILIQWQNASDKHKKQMFFLMFLHFIVSIVLMAVAIAI